MEGRTRLCVVQHGQARAIYGQAVAQISQFSKKRIAWHERIYSGHSGDVLDLIRQVDKRYREVMVIGHNPDMTVLVNELTGSAIANVPTCGIAGIDLPIDNWSDAVSGDLVFFVVPKSI